MSPRPHPSAVHLRRAALDPIRSIDDAVAVFLRQADHPARPETLAMLLDAHHQGSTLITVTGTTEPEQVVVVADTLALAAADHPDVAKLVIASVRPRGGPCADDDRLWFQASDAVARHGLELIDWLVIGRDGVHSPREMLGEPTRWRPLT